VPRIYDLMAPAVQRWPDRPFLVTRDGSRNYRQVDEDVRRVAALLHAIEVRAGDRVAIMTRNRPEFVLVMFACSMIGATFVPLSPKLRGYQLRSVLHDMEAAVLLTADDVEAPGAAGPVGSRTRIVPISVVSAAANGHDVPPSLPGDPRSPAMIMYTSGSTAMPKGIVCPNEQVLFAARSIGACLRYRTVDTVLVAVPLSFDYALYQVLLAGQVGAAVALADADDIASVLACAKANRITVLPVVPSLATFLIRMQARSACLTDVRLVTSTGAVLDEGLADRLRASFPGSDIVPMYGTTECKRITIMPPAEAKRRPGSVGLPLPATSVEIVDPAGEPVPPGTIGEIVVHGRHLTAGYWRDPVATGRAFRRGRDGQRWLYTGDLGYLDQDGYLYFAGRRDDQFKRRGLRTSAVEIEAAARNVDGVEEAALVMGAGGGDDLHLVVTLDGSVHLTPEEVLRGLATRLEPAKIPDRCFVVAALPLSANGKIDKGALMRGSEARS